MAGQSERGRVGGVGGPGRAKRGGRGGQAGWGEQVGACGRGAPAGRVERAGGTGGAGWAGGVAGRGRHAGRACEVDGQGGRATWDGGANKRKSLCEICMSNDPCKTSHFYMFAVGVPNATTIGICFSLFVFKTKS